MHPSLIAFSFYRQFIVYRLVARSGSKADKLPCDYRTGVVVSAHDPQYWTDYETAAATATAWGAGWGIGFVFTEQDPFFFLDIDSCLLNGEWSPLAQSLCQLLSGAAVEVSQSGTGLHIFAVGKPPAHGCRNALGLEFYSSGRFVALTGTNAVGNAAADMSAVLPALVSQYFPPDTASALEQGWTEGPCEGWCGPADDGELLRRAMQSRSTNSAFGQRASFADLWLADERALAASYPDPVRAYDASAADAALAQHLAFWTGRDAERIRRMMQGSKLVRDKWEREDYLPRTILGAVGRQVDVLQDKAAPAPLGALSAVGAPLTVPSGTPDELTPEDFYAHLPTHSYINRRTREFFSVEAINGHLRRFSDGLGMKPSAWLDMFRSVQQMSWQPAYPELIEGMISDKGHLIPDKTGRVYNLFRPSDAVGSDADASPWVNHVKLLYPDEADHIIKWFAYRLLHPGNKINHALVIGGAQGIGKDLMLDPLRYGVGRSNLTDVNPADLFKDFTPWAESTLLIINEARDLGEENKYKFYESSKRFIAAPPDTLPCRRLYLASYEVPNVMGVIITSNNKLSGLYIEGDDRRHYVAWSGAEKQSAEYFNYLWEWMQNGGRQAVVGYLQRLPLEGWDAKADPPKTEAWRQIVEANSNPEESLLGDALEGVQIATLREIIVAAQFKGYMDIALMLQDRKNARKVPHILERIGLEALPNPNSKSDGRWRFGGGKETLYVDRRLPRSERLQLAAKKIAGR